MNLLCNHFNTSFIIHFKAYCFCTKAINRILKKSEDLLITRNDILVNNYFCILCCKNCLQNKFFIFWQTRRPIANRLRECIIAINNKHVYAGAILSTINMTFISCKSRVWYENRTDWQNIKNAGSARAVGSSWFKFLLHKHDKKRMLLVQP